MSDAAKLNIVVHAFGFAAIAVACWATESGWPFLALVLFPSWGNSSGVKITAEPPEGA